MDKAKLISAAGTIPWLGSSLRRIARRYPEGSVVTIRSGPLAGYRWKRSHRYVSGYWLGNYELPIQECLVRELETGDVFYDVGANAGFFTLLAARCVGAEGRVFAFEPLPANIRTIRSQVELNAVDNCTVVEAAVSDRDGPLHFSGGTNTSTAHIQGIRPEMDGTAIVTVAAISLDQFSQECRPPDFIKMDIEGAELLALKGARDLLSSNRAPKLLIEFHGPELRREGCRILRNRGYRFYSVAGCALDDMSEHRHLLCVPCDHTEAP